MANRKLMPVINDSVFKSFVLALLLATIALNVPSYSLAQSPPAPQPTPAINGTLVIAGGGWIHSDLLKKFVRIGGGSQARLVVITTASIYAGTPDGDARLWFWKELPTASFTALHTRSRQEANSEEFSKCLDDATAVWIIGGNQNWVAETYLGTRTEQRLHALLERGGVIGGTSAGAAIMSRVMIGGGLQQPLLREGLGFLPGSIVDQHFSQRKRLGRLTQALDLAPGHVGLGIDEDTIMCVHDREAEVWGDGAVTVCLQPGPNRDAFQRKYGPGERFDLVSLSRAAMDRARKVNTTPSEPSVAAGTLVLTGRGAIDAGAAREFVTAVGPANSPIVVLTDMEGRTVRIEDHPIAQSLKAAGANNVVLLDADAPSGPTLEHWLQVLNEARGVWLADGRPWELIEKFVDSDAGPAVRKILEGGGVVGGSAAGAQIQGEFVAGAEPTSENLPVVEGYSRGMGLLPGVVIHANLADSTRPAANSSTADMLHLEVAEGSSVVVRGGTAKVFGTSNVSVRSSSSDGAAAVRIRPGEGFDLINRRRVNPAEAQDSQ